MKRRAFVTGAVVAGAIAQLGRRPARAVAEPPAETTTVRLPQPPSLCLTPVYVAEELLRSEGFADVRYVKAQPGESGRMLAAGEVDIAMQFAAPLILQVDAGDPIVFLAGGHVGCFELFGTERVRAIRDLKGKVVAVPRLGSPQHVFVASMAAHVGLDPRRDINWVTVSPEEGMRGLATGTVEAFLGFPPQPQELRARKIGHVVVNSAVDRPWSQYFCCMLVASREFVGKHPIATRRALRALVKAIDLCALEPERSARALAAKGLGGYDYALQTMQEIRYGKWRLYDPEDTIRFYALRLHEAGMIKSSPKKIIAQGTDWRFIDALKKELKG